MEKKEKNKVNKKESLLEEKIKLLEESLANEQNRALRLQAEAANIQRHKEEEITNIRKYEGEDLIKDILIIIDDFERALSYETEENKEFLKGFNMIYNKLKEILDNNKVSVIDEKDVDFDPSIHQAVLAETIEGKEPNKIVDILQKGYKYKDKLLRPAMVKVSK